MGQSNSWNRCWSSKAGQTGPFFSVGDTVTAEDLLVGNNAEIEGTLCPGGKKYDGFFQVV